ncbi:MAG: response regulator [Trichloromonas sp.]|jgi:predicted Zn finger-like uncharacterized protein|nr:response regulator [Trichloromonas sp.]
MRIACPNCQASYRFDPARAGSRAPRIKCPGCGHVFRVDLETAVADGAAMPSAPRKKCLIVDDSRFFRELTGDIFKVLEAELLFAGDGEEALRIIREARPDVVLLDLNLPKKNGYELIREVREDKALSKVRLLAMSGVFRKSEEIGEVYRGGADDFIGKSFKPEQLLDRVKKLLED